jgi:hypothetical protein
VIFLPSSNSISTHTRWAFAKTCLDISGKIKRATVKREAWAFTDDCYFKLRLLALHDAGITPFL